MAEDIINETTETVEEPKAAPKRKPAAKRKTTAKRKATASTRTAAKSKTTRGRRGKSSESTLQERFAASGRRAFLASLGLYGMAYDQVQDQLKNVEDELQERRKKADKLYTNMVKRGEKVEKKARAAIDDMELPNFELNELTDRSKIEAHIDKAKERFAELRETVGLKSAA